MARRSAPDDRDAYTTVRLAETRSDRVAAARLRLGTHAGPSPVSEPAYLDLELDEHDSSSRHFLAVEDSGSVATIRLLVAEPGGALPLDAAGGLERDPDRRAAELSRPAIRPDRRDDPALVMALLRAAYDEALTAGVADVYLVADQPLLTLLRGHGFRFRAVSGPMWATGAWSIAAVLAVEEVLPGLRLHQAVHGCRVADFFAAHFTGAIPGHEICARPTG
jgi:predicted GNAT family N-acyltransferase